MADNSYSSPLEGRQGGEVFGDCRRFSILILNEVKDLPDD